MPPDSISKLMALLSHAAAQMNPNLAAKASELLDLLQQEYSEMIVEVDLFGRSKFVGRRKISKAAYDQILDFLRKGSKIPAIKLFREETGESLLVSKETIEKLAERHGIDTYDARTRRETFCTWHVGNIVMKCSWEQSERILDCLAYRPYATSTTLELCKVFSITLEAAQHVITDYWRERKHDLVEKQRICSGLQQEELRGSPSKLQVQPASELQVHHAEELQNKQKLESQPPWPPRFGK